MAGSLTTGLVAALLLAALPLVPAREAEVTGAVLCGFALSWAMLAVLSARVTDQPQRWAAAPALFMGLGGVLLLVFGSPVHEVLNWVWPPALLLLVVWMVVRARRQLRSRSRALLLYPVLAVLALSSIGGAYQTVRGAMDARADPMPGRLVDVGGHALHLSCTGSGSPTVVIEPGGGAASADLERITPVVARDTRVCVYDRAGRGWSEPADSPQDGGAIVTDLHALLERADVPGPYVLAGHSFGGLYVMTFAARYPDEVAGTVLVDSTASSADPPAASPDAASPYYVVDRASALLSAAARLAGVGQLQSTIDEYARGGPSAEHAAALEDLGDKPLFVLTARVGNDDAWFPAQDALATLSTDSTHVVLEDATHASMVDEHADDTTQAILDVVASVRSGE